MAVAPRKSTAHFVSRAFPIPFTTNPREVALMHLKEFWAENEWGGWSGCYIFALGWGDHAVTPWYVGRTARTFQVEAFDKHKLRHYHNIMAKHPRKKPAMMFLSKNEWRGRQEDQPFNFAETELIKMCLQVNPNLLNDKKTAVKQLHILGVTDKMPGRKSTETADFRNMLSVGTNR